MSLSTFSKPVVAAARVGAVAAIGLCISALLLRNHAVAAVEDELFDFGVQLQSMTEWASSKRGRDLTLNGQTLGFHVEVVDRRVSAVLDHYEEWCMRHDGRTADQIHELQRRVDPRADWADARAMDATWRDQREGGGFVACLNTGGATLSADEIKDRFLRFSESGNLLDIGTFHYVFAVEVDTGVRVTSVYTQGDFRVFDMFPEHGDAPGSDVADVPRPKTGRRMLSIAEQGRPYDVAVYTDVTGATSDVADAYLRRLPELGWTVLADRQVDDETRALVIGDENRVNVVVVGEDGAGARYVSVAASEGERDE